MIEAALAVGLQQLTMAAVAERLGVAKAVLYGYVGSREELVRISAAHASRRHRSPGDNGQHWAVWILEYAQALFEMMTTGSELMETWLSGGQSEAVEVDSGEIWLQVMTRRGFTGEEALQLRRAVSHLVLGAAAAAKREIVLRAAGRPRASEMPKAVTSRSPEETALLRQFVDVFSRPVEEGSWEYSLYLLLSGVVVARGALTVKDAGCLDRFEDIAAMDR